MSDDLNTELRFGADTTGAEAGVTRVKRSLKDLGDAATKAGKDVAAAGAQAGKDISKMGDGSDDAAKKLQRNTRNMEGQLQRYLASLEGGSKDSRRYWEAMADFKGADKNALRPLLDQLDTYKAKTVQASEATVSWSSNLRGVGTAAAGIAAITVTAGVAAKAMFEASASAERLRTMLDFATGGNSAREIEFLRGVTYRLGLEFSSTAKAYGQFQAAAKGTALEGEKARGVFESVAKASAVMGLSADQSSGVLLALQQMISKGTVQAEELRGQLGERLPGAFQIAAKAMGVTTAELGKMLEAGEVIADDFLPKFGRALEENLGGAAEKAAQRLDAAVNRFDTAWEKLKQKAGDSGVSKAVAGELGAITRDLEAVTDGMDRAGKAGGGMWAQFGAAGAIGAGRIGFSTLNLAANTLNGSINALTGGVFGLRTNLALLPDVFKTDAEYAASLGQKLASAEAEMAALQARGDSQNPNFYIRNSYFQLQEYIKELKKAQAEQTKLTGGAAPTPNMNEGVTASGRAREAYNTQRAKDMEAANAFRLNQSGVPASYLKDMAELIRLNQAGVIVGKEYNDALKKQQDILLQKTGVTKGAAAAANQEQNTYETLVASIRTKIAANEAEISGAGRLTESDKLRIKLMEELKVGSKTLTAEHKERALALLDILSAQEKEEARIKSLVVAYKQEAEVAEEIAQAYVTQTKAREAGRAVVDSYVNGIDESNKALQYELSLMGLGTSAREVALEQYRIELDLKKQIAAIDANTGFDAAQREEERARARAGAAIAKANAASKAFLDEWKTSVSKYDDIFRKGFADMLNNGKDGWKSFTQSLVTTFKTTVADQIYKMFAQPIVVKLVGSMLGFTGASGAANAATGGSNLLGTALQGTSLYNGLTSGTGVLGSIGNAIGLGVGASTTMGGLGATAIGSYAAPSVAAMTIAPGATAAGAGGMSGALAAIPGWGWALAGVALLGSLAKKFDDSGTPHIGAGAVYSEAGGLQEGAGIYNQGTFGMGIAEEYAKGTQEGVSTIAKSLTQTFDGIAKAFGKTAGYEIATAFADDRSKDGALGSLRISQEGRDLLNWNDTRENKWAPREFANGEDGYKEYLAEIAKDTRTVLLDMDLPSWADTIITSIGDAANMDQLAAAVQQIGQIQTAFSNLGKSIEGFAGMSDKTFESLMKASGGLEALSANAGSYYENFYSEAEKTAAVTRSVSDALAAVGLQMPATRDEFRALVESQLALGEEGAKASATLLGVSGAFASVVPAAADAAGAVEEMVNQITQNLLRDRGRLEADLLRAQGNTTGANAANRLLDIAGYTDAEMALYDYNAALRAQISSLEEASAAAEDARQRAMDGVDAAYSGLERSVGAQRSLVQETISSTREVFDTLRENVRSLYGEVGSTAAMQAAQGRAFITQALSAAQTTGYLPEGKQLQDAIGAVRSGMQSQVYASQADADYQRLVLAGELKDLQDLSGDQLTEAEKQLKALDDILDNASSQVDALNGIDTSVISVEAAIQRLADALLTAKGLGLDKSGAASKAGGEYLAQVTPDMLKGYTQSQIIGADNWTFGSREAITQAWQGGDYAAVADIVQRAGMSQSGLQNTFGLSDADLAYVNSLDITGVDPTKAVAGHDIVLGNGTATNTGQSALFDSLALQAQAALAAGNEAGIYADAAARGLDSGDINALLGLPEGSAEEWARKAGLPVLRVGTNYVEEDGLHYLHKGEAVIPQPYNPAAGGAGNSTARLEALVEGLTKEVQRLQAVVNDGNREQRRTANAVNGNPDMPMLVQTV